jgi:cytochrome c
MPQYYLQASIKQGISTYGLNDVALSIKDAPTGMKPSYFCFAADADAPDAVLGAVLTIEFMRS